MSELIAKIMIEGDKHFCSKNYGGHRDYANEVVAYDKMVLNLIEKEGITHYINCGDFSYGRFHTLEYRGIIDELLAKRKELLGNNVWFIRGNHDKESSGKTEYEYYLEKGAFRGAETLDFGIGTAGGGLHIEMKNYGEIGTFTAVQGASNILIGHGLYTSKDDDMNDFGKPNVNLDECEAWKDVDLIFTGHIHTEHFLKTKVCGKDIAIHYLPCLARPSYMRDGMPAYASIDIITVYDDKVDVERYQMELLPLDVSFDLEAIKRKDAETDEKERVAVDVKEVAQRMEQHVMEASDPVAVIEHAVDIPEEVKTIAVELLKEAGDARK